MEGQRDLNPNKPIENSISDAEKMRSFLETEQIKLAKEFMEKQKDLPLEEQITISADFRIVPPTKTFSDTQRMAANENIFKNHRCSFRSFHLDCYRNCPLSSLGSMELDTSILLFCRHHHYGRLWRFAPHY